MKVSFLAQSLSEKVTLLLLAKNMRDLKAGITGSIAVRQDKNQAGYLAKLLNALVTLAGEHLMTIRQENSMCWKVSY
ncbi:hypothetical protein PSMEN_22475 [Ectopseudomonas mendocina]|nr:hypothetical protein PSMEN_22475 [Pseudomonas mendocina]